MNRVNRYIMQAADQLRIIRLRSAAYEDIAQLDAEYFFSPEPVPFDERMNFPMKKASFLTRWSNAAYGCGWFHFMGTVPKSAEGKRLSIMVDIDAEGCFYSNDGVPIRGVTQVSYAAEHTNLYRGKPELRLSDIEVVDGKIDVWLEAGSNKAPYNKKKGAYFQYAKLCAKRDDVGELFYDYVFLAMMKACTPRGSEKFKAAEKALDEAYRVSKGFSAENVKKAIEVLKKETEKGEKLPYNVYAVGHGHLDLAWLWPLRETKRKAVRTFTNQLRNSEEIDGYVFGASQAQQFEWIENEHPKLFSEIRRAVAEGRIEVQGAMWVECDTNVTGGESLIRQNLYGKKYWKEKFNKPMNFCWLPDTFGYNGNLPQIMKKSGVDYFLTTKLSWNEHNKFPKRTFVWQGIDDSEVIVHMPPEDTYNGQGNPFRTLNALDKYPEKDKVKTFGILYGVGDGGGGPGEGFIELVRRQEKAALLPTVKMSPATVLFEELGTQRDVLDVVKGELYLEKHQGTYTTQARNKNFNRRIEFALHNVEFLSAAAERAGCPYPAAELEKIWKEVLLYQFHDIIPGSSIERVYLESRARYEAMMQNLLSLQNRALRYLVDGTTPSAINATGFIQRQLIVNGDESYMAAVKPYSAAPIRKYVPVDIFFADDTSLENAAFRIKFDSSGNMISLYDKQYSREICGDYLNRFNLYHDIPKEYDAWDIEWEYFKKQPSSFTFVSATSKVGEGYAYVENTYRYGDSTLVQQVRLEAFKPYVIFSTEVDWKEKHKMLRAEFRPTVFADEVTCDIQMGKIKRTTHDRTPVEHAQFEICAHKYVDLSSNGYGVAMLSDSKYGWRVKEGTISLNLLRSPTWPDPNADTCVHSFSYALYPHNGDVCEAEVAKHAYLFNNPLILCDGNVVLPSIASTDNRDVVVETVKKAETGEGLVVRMYENAGQETTCKVNLGVAYESVSETNLLEQGGEAIETAKPIYFKPFEIKTFLVK